MNKAILAVGATLFFSAFAQAQLIEVEKLGDEELSCQELYTEVKSMDQVIALGAAAPATAATDPNVAAANAPNAAATANAVNAATQIAAQSGNYSAAANLGAFGSIFGRLAAAAAANNTANAQPVAVVVQNSAINGELAQKRKAHMTSLFKAQKCKVKGLK